MRLDKYLANLGYGSRSQVGNFIKKELVKVNDKVVKDKSFKIDLNIDTVSIDGEIVKKHDDIVIILNKPIGYLSSNASDKYPSVLKLLDEEYQNYDLKIAGRLDVETTGLLIITNSKSLVKKITHPKFLIEKKYITTLNKKLHEKDIEVLKNGVIILDGKGKEYLAKPTKISYSGNKCEITITSGKYHQVRRMFKYIGYDVLELKRISIGKINLEELQLPQGKYKIIKVEDFNYD